MILPRPSTHLNSVLHVTVTAPNISEPCSLTSNKPWTLSWPDTRGATEYYVQIYDMINNERHNLTVRVTDVLLNKEVKSNRQYIFYVTGLGSENQRGNTVSCTGNTGTLPIINLYLISYFLSGHLCLQCFDAVGWAAGRASGL